ncbi:MAG: hypothetical protein KY453_08075 [Gemmatimonadetes bacterium]|nr:hypothetical protein [Gemmatimonadota bacterium]
MTSFAPRRKLLATLVPLVLIASACGSATSASSADPFERAGSRNIRIEVTNLNFNDATLHALRGGERHRLGTVTGKGSASYTMDWPLPQPLRIQIDLLAGGDCTTRSMQVDPGDIIELQIELDLERDPDCF